MLDTIIVNQPFSGQLGSILSEYLVSGKYSSLNIVVAFAKNSGVLRIKEPLRQFKRDGGEINAYVGIDLDGTSYEALLNLLPLVNNLYVVHLESEQTFHSKIYNFVGDEDSVLVVGSNNLTAGGLWTNLESCSIATFSASDTYGAKLQQSVYDYIADIEGTNGLSRMLTCTDDVDELLDNGYLSKEAQIHVHRATRDGRSSSFGRDTKANSFAKKLTVALPKLGKKGRASHSESPEPSVRLDNASTERSACDTVWFETRALTGGSRNILDLSKVSLIKKGSSIGTQFALDDSSKHMKGGVSFFGIDSNDTSKELDITINYEGTDYFGNTIKYPKGDKANGTWRLQIKGVSEAGDKITEAVASGYFAHKVLVFTRVVSGYYYLSVFSGDDLLQFEEASKIVGYNGKRRGTKLFGLW